MAVFKAFKAIRPSGDAKDVAALPYDVYNSKEARDAVKDNPKSFLNIDRAEVLFPEGTSPYEDKVYEKAKETLWKMVEEGVYLREEKEAFYVYRLEKDFGRKNVSQTGIVGLCSIDDYEEGIIKKHENTLEAKEQDRIRHIDTLNAQTGPIFLAYKGDDGIEKLIKNITSKEPLYDFTAPDDGVRQTIWKADDEGDIDQINKYFKEKDLYIADGHHRAASAVKVGLKRRKENPDKHPESDYFLTVVFPSSELFIMDYNRVVKDLNGLSEEGFLDKVKEIFDVRESDSAHASPDKKYHFGMYLGGRWYDLCVRKKDRVDDSVGNLDVSYLHNLLIEPILGISDPKKDPRIDFVGGIRGMGELEKRCEKDCVAAFSMYPTSMDELMKVADEKRLMPPKSTWFEPKLHSGFFIHDLT